MRSDEDLLRRAVQKAYFVLNFHPPEGRLPRYIFGAVAERRDGALVVSTNHSTRGIPAPSGHAEARVLRKLGRFGRVAVARVHRDGSWAIARPCPGCMSLLRRAKVLEVYYTIGPREYGVIKL